MQTLVYIAPLYTSPLLRHNRWIGRTILIDAEGFRPNVGIIITNDAGQLFWARRINGQDAWQFPQGGINQNESPTQALYRELYEEVGLTEEHVDIVACTRGWLRYRLPRRLIRTRKEPVCIGQKQKWFLLRLTAGEQEIDLARYGHAEFDRWQWVSYWYPLNKVVSFKRDVYRRALKELSSHHSLLEEACGRT